MPSALDGRVEFALVLGAGCSLPARNNAGVRREEALQNFYLFIVDILEVIVAEIALLWFFYIHILKFFNYSFLLRRFDRRATGNVGFKTVCLRRCFLLPDTR